MAHITLINLESNIKGFYMAIVDPRTGQPLTGPEESGQNGAGNNVGVTGVPHGPFNYNDATGELTITTMLDGQITIDIDGAEPGFYTYTSPATAVGDVLDFTVNANPGFAGEV